MSESSEETGGRGRDEAERLFVDHLALIERLMRSVARRKGLRDDEAEEFQGWAKLKLVQGDYRIFRRYRGDSSLAGYLTTVLLRLALDYVIQEKGKWRPSKRAQRQGRVAVQLETLVHRDGVELEQAIAILRGNLGVLESAEELRRMAAEIRRTPQRRFEGEETVARLPSGDLADRRVDEGEVAAIAERAAQGLSAALGELPPEDRLILRLLFEEGIPVSKVARQLRVDQRRLYTRRDGIFRTLRRDLERRGLDADDVARLVGWGCWADAVTPAADEIGRAGPSLGTGNGAQTGGLHR
ncbi:MAG: sigma-70 family RNA polymerase sigma factor [Acidobacteriota bacterium]